MNDEQKQQAITEMIKKTYEDLGMAVLDIEPVGIASFKCNVIDHNGPKEVIVTILLHMINANQC